MRLGQFVWAWMGSALALCGCGLIGDDGRVCTALYAYGISVNITDGTTGEPVTDATLTLIDGDYSETMQPFPSGGYAGAGERQGTYTLVIEVPGVPVETIDEIAVDHDGCHVIGVAFDVEVESGQLVITQR